MPFTEKGKSAGKPICILGRKGTLHGSHAEPRGDNRARAGSLSLGLQPGLASLPVLAPAQDKLDRISALAKGHREWPVDSRRQGARWFPTL